MPRYDPGSKSPFLPKRWALQLLKLCGAHEWKAQTLNPKPRRAAKNPRPECPGSSREPHTRRIHLLPHVLCTLSPCQATVRLKVMLAGALGRSDALHQQGTV